MSVHTDDGDVSPPQKCDGDDGEERKPRTRGAGPRRVAPASVPAASSSSSSSSPPAPPPSLSSPLPRLYLASLGFVYLVAFLSYRAQYPALSSRSGLQPSGPALERSFPEIHRQFVAAGSVDADGLVEIGCFVGIVASATIASGVVQHGSLFVVISAVYHFLIIIGGSFYTFQWDSLLTETGFLTAVCFAPWLAPRPPAASGPELGASAWPLRVLLFKLMLMSGVVKIQSGCPTWSNLTALEYHFATQCLPGPIAWHASQLPPLLLRLGVAAMFVVEIPAAFLLILPSVEARRVGARMQVFLQILIIATGNYNFFNLLTMALCLPCVMDDRPTTSGRGRTVGSAILFQRVACAAFLILSCWEMFTADRVPDPLADGQTTTTTVLRLAWTKASVDRWVERIVPIAVPAVVAFALLSGIRGAASARAATADGGGGGGGGGGSMLARGGGRRWSMITSSANTLVCCVCILFTSAPMAMELTPLLRRSGFWGIRFVEPLWQRTRRYNVSNGYGLFRSMTGMGRVSEKAISDPSYGWAGLPPSVVARPEIIVEATFVDRDGAGAMASGDEEWHELNFRWKPGDVTRRPKQVAPHQPRFDWLMWFAALGSADQNPWFVSFLDNLLRGCPRAFDLLDEPDLSDGMRRVAMVRATLYEYDFTRLDSDWNRRIPGANILRSGVSPVGGAPPPPWWTGLFRGPRQYWTRTAVRQYLHPIEEGDPSVRDFLRARGYETALCANDGGDESQLCPSSGEKARPLCVLAAAARRWNDPLFPVIILLVVWILRWAKATKLRDPVGSYKKNNDRLGGTKEE